MNLPGVGRLEIAYRRLSLNFILGSCDPWWVAHVTFEIDAQVGVSTPIPIDPTVSAQRGLQVLSHVVQLVFALLRGDAGCPAPVNTWPDMTLMPYWLGCLDASLRCQAHHPFVCIVRPELRETVLVDDAEAQMPPNLSSSGTLSLPNVI